MTASAIGGMEFGEYDLPHRNRLAARTIQDYALGHAAADAVIGLAGFLPVPGAALMSIGASLLVQVPIYKCLAADLGKIYVAPSPDATVDKMVSAGIARGAALELGATLGTDALVDLFGSEFIEEVVRDLASEIGISLGVSLVPFFGGFISTGLDVLIAVTMTWRVGTMVSMYYQNGQQWPGGSRRQTYRRAKEFTGGLSATNSGRVDLDDVARRDDSVSSYAAEKLSKFVETILKVAPDTSDSKLHELLRERNVSKEVSEKAINIARKRLR